MTLENNSIDKKVYTPVKLSLLGNIADMTKMAYGTMMMRMRMMGR